MNKEMPARKLLRRKTAATVLDCDIQLLKRLEKEGKLTPIRLGKRYVSYGVGEVEALAQGHKRRRAPR
jgi:hypothetical protein